MLLNIIFSFYESLTRFQNNRGNEQQRGNSLWNARVERRTDAPKRLKIVLERQQKCLKRAYRETLEQKKATLIKPVPHNQDADPLTHLVTGHFRICANMGSSRNLSNAQGALFDFDFARLQ